MPVLSLPCAKLLARNGDYCGAASVVLVPPLLPSLALTRSSLSHSTSLPHSLAGGAGARVALGHEPHHVGAPGARPEARHA
eukprot:1617908-Rhodomonas_salina.1